MSVPDTNRNIVISDATDTVVLLNDLIFDTVTNEVSKTSEMASGKLVKDISGYRETLNIPVGYLSVEDMSKLKNMILKHSGLLSIKYPTLLGVVTKKFLVDMPPITPFSYNNEGVAIWKGFTLTAKAVEVDKDETYGITV